MSALDSGRYSVAAGCVGHLPGLRRRVGAVRDRAQAVRPPDRVVPARAGDARRDEGQDRRGADAGLARGLAEGHRAAEHDRDVDREVLRHRGGGLVRQRGDPGARRLRLRRRLPGRALLPRRARHDALRGHLADPEADHRPRADGHQRARSASSDLAAASGAWAALVVGVIGAGTMGAGIAQLALGTGAETFLVDPLPGALERGEASIRDGLERWAAKGREVDAALPAHRRASSPRCATATSSSRPRPSGSSSSTSCSRRSRARSSPRTACSHRTRRRSRSRRSRAWPSGPSASSGCTSSTRRR